MTITIYYNAACGASKYTCHDPEIGGNHTTENGLAVLPVLTIERMRCAKKLSFAALIGFDRVAMQQSIGLHPPRLRTQKAHVP